jgi:hypothetical protein
MANKIGAAPNYATDRPGQIRRVFEMAREFDVDIDLHLDSGATAEQLDTLPVCDLTEAGAQRNWTASWAFFYEFRIRKPCFPSGFPMRRLRTIALCAPCLRTMPGGSAPN